MEINNHEQVIELGQASELTMGGPMIALENLYRPVFYNIDL